MSGLKSSGVGGATSPLLARRGARPDSERYLTASAKFCTHETDNTRRARKFALAVLNTSGMVMDTTRAVCGAAGVISGASFTIQALARESLAPGSYFTLAMAISGAGVAAFGGFLIGTACATNTAEGTPDRGGPNSTGDIGRTGN